MALLTTLGVLVVLLSTVTFVLGVANVAVTCTRVVYQCVVTSIYDVPTFLFMTYTGVALWASLVIALTGLYATNEIKEAKKDLNRLATLTFLSCFLFAPAIISLNVAEAYYFQTLFPVANYVLDINNPYLVKFSINVAIASLGLIIYIPLFPIFASVYCCPAKLTKDKAAGTNKTKESSTNENKQ